MKFKNYIHTSHDAFCDNSPTTPTVFLLENSRASWHLRRCGTRKWKSPQPLLLPQGRPFLASEAWWSPGVSAKHLEECSSTCSWLAKSIIAWLEDGKQSRKKANIEWIWPHIPPWGSQEGMQGTLSSPAPLCDKCEGTGPGDSWQMTYT